MESITTLIVFAAYLVMMLGIGWISSGRASNNLSAYYLADRKLNKWVVALSAQASDMSGWLLMGVPGAVFLSGLSEMWICIGLAIGTYVNWKTVAQKLRVYSHVCGDSITLPDFFANRFHDRTGLLRMISALCILFFFLLYTASGFVACAKLFSTTFGLSYNVALLAGILVIVSYTFLGGFLAVCWTDFVQGTLMLIALVMVPVAIIREAGWFSGTVDTLNAMNPFLLNIFTNAGTGKAISFIGLCSGLAWGLGYFGMPHILVRFMAIDNAKKIREARWIACSWVAISLAAAVIIGLLGRHFVASRGIDVADAETIFMLMIKGLFPTIIAAVFMVAILAAIMSTADSQLLVSASAFSSDFYKTILRKKATNRELVFVSRAAVVLIAVLAGGLAYFGNQSGDTSLLVIVRKVMDLVSFAWSGFGAAFGPLVILSLYWRRTNFPGAVAGMIVGAATVIIWKLVLSPMGDTVPLFKLYELAPGFILSLLTIVIVSLCTRPPAKEIGEEFDRIAKESPF